PLHPDDRTLERSLRRWVEQQTRQPLGYVEQLYTFGDLDRFGRARPPGRPISVAYLALVRDAQPAGATASSWRDWYDHLPWEDHRRDHRLLALMTERLQAWAETAPTIDEAKRRRERVRLTFGDGIEWDNERVLERYELAYEAGLVAEALRDAGKQPADLPPSVAMGLDHRRILATAIGRLRAKIKYRPVLFELMPPAFTLLELQHTAEAISGALLHKQNFRRLVEQGGLVEPAPGMSRASGGRPARLMRFRPEVVLERPAPGVRIGAGTIGLRASGGRASPS
ncbi:NUDIX hydrolase, partial [Geminicoccus flavidas]|uniref:NUDIX hydrolase n=1 Tax=Geminicoccus flavidas TaxID=2506407 RepID=UPI001F23B696